ncbi:MAG: DUF6765 family protein, partial [Candidatus Binataceae bacterium]
MNRPWIALCSAIALTPILMGTAARAWEADVHEGLTKWLALKSGFSQAEADQVAQGDGGMDESSLTSAPSASLLHIILLGDVNAAEAMQAWHFPSYAKLPCAPQARAVTHDSRAARDPVEQAIHSPLSDRDKALNQLGQRLHAFQDSWSHEGIPDTPFRPFPYEVRPDLIWSHPALRGGWHSHDADLTHLHVDQTVEMAARTYDMLGEFLTANPAPTNSPRASKTEIERGVRDFAQLSSGEQKKAWFLRQGFDPAEANKIAGELSLPQSENKGGSAGVALSGAFGALLSATADRTVQAQDLPSHSTTTGDGGLGRGTREGGVGRGEPTGSGAGGRGFPQPSILQLLDLVPEIPYDETQDLSRAAQRLMDAWILDQNIEAAREYFDPDEIQAQLAPLGLDAAATNQWISRFLTMWLVQDHGLVNAAGHGMPDAPGYSTLADSPGGAERLGVKTIKVRTLRDAIQAGVRPFKIAPA